MSPATACPVFGPQSAHQRRLTVEVGFEDAEIWRLVGPQTALRRTNSARFLAPGIVFRPAAHASRRSILEMRGVLGFVNRGRAACASQPPDLFLFSRLLKARTETIADHQAFGRRSRRGCRLFSRSGASKVFRNPPCRRTTRPRSSCAHIDVTREQRCEANRPARLDHELHRGRQRRPHGPLPRRVAVTPWVSSLPLMAKVISPGIAAISASQMVRPPPAPWASRLPARSERA